jgi:hypothetical protein
MFLQKKSTAPESWIVSGRILQVHQPLVVGNRRSIGDFSVVRQNPEDEIAQEYGGEKICDANHTAERNKNYFYGHD